MTKIKKLSSMCAGEAYDTVRNNWIASLFEALPEGALRASHYSGWSGGWGNNGAHCPRTQFDGNEFYSYRAVIAQAFRHEDGNVLVVCNTQTYSMMTSQHQRALHSGLARACAAEPRLSMVSVDCEPASVRATALQAIKTARTIAGRATSVPIPTVNSWRSDPLVAVEAHLADALTIDTRWQCLTIEDHAAMGQVRSIAAEARARFERLAIARLVKAQKGGPGAPALPDPYWLPVGSAERKLVETMRAMDAR